MDINDRQNIMTGQLDRKVFKGTQKATIPKKRHRFHETNKRGKRLSEKSKDEQKKKQQ